jgi:hypothetical protein
MQEFTMALFEFSVMTLCSLAACSLVTNFMNNFIDVDNSRFWTLVAALAISVGVFLIAGGLANFLFFQD